MNRFDALNLAVAIHSLHGLACAAKEDELIRGKGAVATDDLLTRSDHALSLVRQLGLNDGLTQSSRVAVSAGHYINSEKDVTSTKAHLVTVVNTVLNELREHAFLRVSPQRRDYVDNEQLFGSDVYRSFPSARFDIKEAGNCLAAERNTAAVFHLMRAVEWGLRAVCVDLGHRRLRSKDRKTGKVTFKPLEYSEWEAILNQVRSRVTARLSQLKRGRNKQSLQEFYLPVLQDVEVFKDAFRNHVMHTRRNYAHLEAEMIRDRVERFMRLLATRVQEV